MVISLFIIFLLLPSYLLAAPSTPSSSRLLPRKNPTTCFLPSSGINLLPVSASDCWKSAAKINCSDKLLVVPMGFSRNPTIGFEVPYSGWSYGTCNVVIDLVTDRPHEVATIPLAYVGTAILNLINDCVTGFGLGGMTTVTRETGGSSDILSLVIKGQVVDPDELGAERTDPQYTAIVAQLIHQCSNL